MGMKNDVSFLLAETLSIYEHQSTLNPNLPARDLIYFGMVLGKYVEDEKNRINLYSSTQQSLPVPKLVCFYNGEDTAEERSTLELASAFPTDADADITVRVTMLNINHGKNIALMESCQALKEYSWFIKRIREYKNEGFSVEESVDLTLNEIPQDALLKPILTDNRAEVKRMCITEYDEEKHMRMEREEHEKIGREEGMKEGMKEGIKVGVVEVAKIYRDELGLAPSEITVKIMDRFNLSRDDAEKYVAEIAG